MKKEIIKTNSAPNPGGFYSQGIKVKNLIFTSGQLSIDPKSGKIIKGNIKTQAIQVLSNLRGILEEAGSSLEKVIKMTVFLSDIDYWPEVDNTIAEFFNKNEPPSRTIISGIKLHYDLDVEIEMIAWVD